MDCVACGSAAVTEGLECTARGYRRFRCRECGKQYNERSGSLLNHTHYPSDVIALVVLWRLRYRLTLCDLAEIRRARMPSHPQRKKAPAARRSDQAGHFRSATARAVAIRLCAAARLDSNSGAPSPAPIDAR
jgi:hypothetical protein